MLQCTITCIFSVLEFCHGLKRGGVQKSIARIDPHNVLYVPNKIKGKGIGYIPKHFLIFVCPEVPGEIGDQN